MDMQSALSAAARKARGTNHLIGKGQMCLADSMGTEETRARARAARNGSQTLLIAIEDLITRTATRIDVPAEFKGRKLAFARAYLGMEVRG